MVLHLEDRCLFCFFLLGKVEVFFKARGWGFGIWDTRWGNRCRMQRQAQEKNVDAIFRFRVVSLGGKEIYFDLRFMDRKKRKKWGGEIELNQWLEKNMSSFIKF